ncbi:MAG: hypothetical protein ABJD57_05740, partial [Roseibium sp.]
KHGALMDQYAQMAGLRDSREARAAATHENQMSEYEYAAAKRAEKDAREAEERAKLIEISEQLGGLGATPGGAGQVPAPGQSGQGNAYPIGTTVGEDPAAPQQRYAAVPPRPELSLGALAPSVAPQPTQQPTAPANAAPATVAGESDADFAARVAAAQREADETMRRTAPGSAVAGVGGSDVAGGEGSDRLAQPTQASTKPAIVEDIHRLRGKEGPSVDRDISMALGRVAAELNSAGSLPGRFIGGAVDYVTKSHDERDASMAERRMMGAASEWYQSPEAVEYFKANPGEFERVQQDPLGTYARANGQATPGQSAPSDKVPSKKGQEAEETAAKPEHQQAASMSLETAVGAAHDTKVALGLPPSQSLTKKQMDRGAQAYADRFYEVVVPQAAQLFIRQGNIEKAQKLVELVESRQGKAALKDIGRSTVAMVNGDIDGAAEYALSAFKKYDYVDPDMEVDLEATGIVKDDNGQPAGGEVVFRDKKSGKTFTKTFASADEFMRWVHMMVSPTTVSDMLVDRKPQEKGAITQQDVVKMANEIVKADLTGQTTHEQALDQALATLGRLGVSVGGMSGGGAEPPLYRLNQ